MGIYHSGPTITIVANDGMEQVSRMCKALGAKSGIEEIGIKALRHAAFLQAKYVREGYQNFRERLRVDSTRQIYAQGKLPGVTPARGVFEADSDLHRTGKLAESVKMLHKGRYCYAVEIDPKATYTPDPFEAGRNYPVAAVASQLEAPRPEIIRITRQALNFLFAVKDGINGVGGGRVGMRAPSDQIVDFVIVRQRPRPVWGPAHRRFQSEGVKAVASYLDQLLARTIRRAIKTVKATTEGKALGMVSTIDVGK